MYTVTVIHNVTLHVHYFGQEERESTIQMSYTLGIFIVLGRGYIGILLIMSHTLFLKKKTITAPAASAPITTNMNNAYCGKMRTS